MQSRAQPVLLHAGFCPFTEFERTKHDFGTCTNLHDDQTKADWDAMDDRERDRLGFERDLKKWLDKLMVDLKQKISRNETRLAAQEDVLLLPEDQVPVTVEYLAFSSISSRSDMYLPAGARRSAEWRDSGVRHARRGVGRAGQRRRRTGCRACLRAPQGALMCWCRLQLLQCVPGISSCCTGLPSCTICQHSLTGCCSQATKAKFEEEAQKRAGGGASRYGQQEVCPFSGVIVNKEESRVRDHKNGRNYRCGLASCTCCSGNMRLPWPDSWPSHSAAGVPCISNAAQMQITCGFTSVRLRS